MSNEDAIKSFWRTAKAEKKLQGEYVSVFGFGDNKALKDELIQLVLQGDKRATASLVKEIELTEEPEPKEGEYNILLDGDDRPRAVMKTTSVERVRFKDVSPSFAWAEGEGDRSLESWRKEHIKYWKRVGEKLGFTFNEDMEIILERFELLYP